MKSRQPKRSRGPILLGVCLVVAMLAAAGIGGRSFQSDSASAAPLAAPLTVAQISGNINGRAIEIDDLDNNPNTTPNANMTHTAAGHAGMHTSQGCPSPAPPAPPAADQDCPTVAGAQYIDWNDLAPAAAGKHVILDPSGNTDNSFAGSGTSSCLQPDHAAPQKEDILRVYLANNSEYLYFGLVDKSASGDSRHVILIHRNPIDVGANCSGNGNQLSLNLDPGDKLIRATFKPSASEPASQLYNLIGDPGLQLIDPASNFGNAGLWAVGSQAANFAVNTTQIASDALGGNIPVIAETFGEGAFSLMALGIPPCGANLFVSIITRSSGSGGGEAKDFVGGRYNFGGVTATAQLTATCSLNVDYTGTATDSGGGQVMADSAFDWKFYRCKGTAPAPNTAGCDTVNDQTGVLTAVDTADELVQTIPDQKASPPAFDANADTKHANGDTYYGVLVVTDPGNASCTDAAGSNTVVVYTPIAVNPVMAGSCDASGSWTFNAQPNTTSTCVWTFTDSNATRTHTPTSSNAISGNGTTDRGNALVDTISGSVTCTQTRATDSLVCTASGNASADVYAPLQVDIGPDNTSLACTVPGTPGSNNGNIGPGITFTPTVSGGSGSVTRSWSVTGPNTANALTCGSTASCIVDIPDDNFCALTTVSITVTDTNAATTACVAATSETEDVTKTTSVGSTNKP